MTTARRVNYNGADLTLQQLAKATGISYPCLCRRYARGDRAPALWRPLDCVGGNKGKSRSSFRGEGVNARFREEEAAKRAGQLARRQEQTARAAALKAAHEAELRRPVIDASLLSRREHAEIRERVKFSGQRCWRTNGAAY